MQKAFRENDVIEGMGTFFLGNPDVVSDGSPNVWWRGLTEKRLRTITDKALAMKSDGGDGVTCDVDGLKVVSGTEDYVKNHGIGIPSEGRARLKELARQKKTCLVTAVNGYAAGVVVL